MRRVSMKAILGTVAVGALLGGCATTAEIGPGYYHYDTGLVQPSAPAVVYQEPAVVYHEPAVVYHGPAVVYREPTVINRSGRDTILFNDHGQ
jgi:hypothetical protein